MSSGFLLIRSLIIYAICLPLAIFLGYLLATPQDMTSFVMVTLVLALLTIPLFMRWHHPWLIATWNMQAFVFFMPGRPQIGLVMCAISLGISVVQHTLNRKLRFLHVPAIAWPLCFLGALTLITAELTGGIGMQILGSTSYGGRRYVWILGGILGYFALTAQRIPPRKVVLYVSLFFLSLAVGALGDLAAYGGPPFHFLFYVFPPETMQLLEGGSGSSLAMPGVVRLAGPMMVGTAIFSVMLAIYGIEGIFGTRKYWRVGLFLLAFVASLFGGFRSVLIGFIFTFALVFWFEGLVRSRMFPALLLGMTLVMAATIPFTEQLPLAIQRTISFVPYIHINPIAEMDARSSTDWRLEMWRAVLPEVPKYLLLGKGYSINPAELEMAQLSSNETAEGSILAGDYHNGPLSVIVPFGIFGVIGFVWFIWAGIKALYNNYRFGDPEFRRINTYLLAHFIGKALFFVIIFGSLFSDLAIFAGLLGLSVCINGGVRSPAPVRRRVMPKFSLAPAPAQAGASR